MQGKAMKSDALLFANKSSLSFARRKSSPGELPLQWQEGGKILRNYYRPASLVEISPRDSARRALAKRRSVGCERMRIASTDVTANLYTRRGRAKVYVTLTSGLFSNVNFTVSQNLLLKSIQDFNAVGGCQTLFHSHTSRVTGPILYC
jgi:hypothetical protein